MANLDNPHGLRCIGTMHGGPPETDQFSKVVGYGTAIFRGDAVNQVADGSIEASATPGTTLYSGVALNYGAASTATDHGVIVDPFAIFEAQADGALAAADMGLNANLVLTAGSATTKISKHQINSATENTTATLDVKLRKKLNVPDNEWGAYVRIEIVFNKHRAAFAVAGV
jgi:hypothetical protein